MPATLRALRSLYLHYHQTSSNTTQDNDHD